MLVREARKSSLAQIFLPPPLEIFLSPPLEKYHDVYQIIGFNWV